LAHPCSCKVPPALSSQLNAVRVSLSPSQRRDSLTSTAVRPWSDQHQQPQLMSQGDEARQVPPTIKGQHTLRHTVWIWLVALRTPDEDHYFM
jgi:hypothetical protein